MKKFMVLGALAGSGISLAGGAMVYGSAWPMVIWRSCLAALAGAVIFRWLGRVWLQCVREAQAEAQAARAKAEAQENQNKPVKK